MAGSTRSLACRWLNGPALPWDPDVSNRATGWATCPLRGLSDSGFALSDSLPRKLGRGGRNQWALLEANPTTPDVPLSFDQ